MPHLSYGAGAGIIALMIALPAAAQGPLRGDFYFTVGYAGINSDIDSDAPQVAIDDGLRFIGGQKLEIPAVTLDIPHLSLVGGSFGYKLTDQFSIEGLVGIPPDIDVETGGLLAPLGKLGSFGTGDLVPLLLNVVWSPLPHRAVRPYVGVGPALLWIRGFDVSNPVTEALLEIDFPEYNVGWGAQAGLSFDISEDWFINVDAKYVRAEIEDIKLEASGLGELGDALDISLDIPKTELQIISFGIGRRF